MAKRTTPTFIAKLPPHGKDPWLEQALHVGEPRTKYARIVWRVIQGERRWFVQLAQEGLAPQKYRTTDGAIVGTDVGPSTIAVYSETAVALVPLAPEIDPPCQETKRLQRAMDRSRRATNPHCYNANGTWKKGEKVTTRSANYQALRKELAEERVLEKTRDRSHGRLANQIVALGNVHHSEKLSHRSLQKNFGRSTKVRAAGSLMQKIRRKVERTGAYLELNTWSLKLSQYDHFTEVCTKKLLNERWHVLGDGSGVVQRDLYSAFLAFTVLKDENDQQSIHPSCTADAWPVAQSLLGRSGWMRSEPVKVSSLLATAAATSRLPAAKRIHQPANGLSVLVPAPGVVVPLHTEQRVERQTDLVLDDTRDAVAARREPVKVLEDGLRTPCL